MGLGNILGLAAGAIGAPFTGGASLWGPMIAKTGLGIAGSLLGANAANQPEKWRQKIIEQEMARRNMMQGMAMPALMGSLGYRDPHQVGMMSRQVGTGSYPKQLGGK